jgi:alkaline phosphatase
MIAKKRSFKAFILVFLLAVFTVPGLCADDAVKNIIFMVPDGLGLSNVTAARIFIQGPGGQGLRLESLSEIGYQRTHSANSLVTDSAAAASAWACGEKFDNGEISHHTDSGISPPTILEWAKARGKSTGLVATSTITHATPAAFGAHIYLRKCENEIARQYIEVTGVDVLLGGGVSRFNSTGPDPCGVSGNFINTALTLGYQVVYDKDQLDAVVPGEIKLLGLFSDAGMTPEYLRINDPANTEPHLWEMTAKALQILEKNDDGFFLLVEGSQIDWGNHANDIVYQIGETLAFDRAVDVVLDWLKAKRNRRNNTLVIVVSDHDTGGFAINGPYGSTITGPGEFVEDGWTSDGHTAQDTMIWSQGPYSEHLGRAIDNTEIFYVMKAALYGKRYPGKN